jgi:hypothetical protein
MTSAIIAGDFGLRKHGLLFCSDLLLYNQETLQQRTRDRHLLCDFIKETESTRNKKPDWCVVNNTG